jgi:hypothetical protein
MALGLLHAMQPQKPIYGYADSDDTYAARIERWKDSRKSIDDLARWRFSTIDMHINLMMEMAMVTSGAFIASGFESCVARISGDWRAGRFIPVSA